MSGQLEAVATVLSWTEHRYCLNRMLAGSNSKYGCLGEERLTILLLLLLGIELQFLSCQP
jgi:hypothetical protein